MPSAKLTPVSGGEGRDPTNMRESHRYLSWYRRPLQQRLLPDQAAGSRLEGSSKGRGETSALPLGT